MGVRRDKEIWAQITRQIELWERGLHAVLVGDAESEGKVREGRAASGGEEEDEVLAQSYHSTFLSGKIWQAVCRANNREGGGCLLPDDLCTKTGQQVAEVLQEKHWDMRVSPMENPACTAFKRYKKVP